MYTVYGNGGVVLGFSQTLDEAKKLLGSVSTGWITASGQIIEMKRGRYDFD